MHYPRLWIKRYWFRYELMMFPKIRCISWTPVLPPRRESHRRTLTIQVGREYCYLAGPSRTVTTSATSHELGPHRTVIMQVLLCTGGLTTRVIYGPRPRHTSRIGNSWIGILPYRVHLHTPGVALWAAYERSWPDLREGDLLLERIQNVRGRTGLRGTSRRIFWLGGSNVRVAHLRSRKQCRSGGWTCP